MVNRGPWSPTRRGRTLRRAVRAIVVAGASSAATAVVLMSSVSSAAIGASSPPPATVTATALPKSSPSPFKPFGTVVRAAIVGVSSNLAPVPRVFVNTRDGVSMATGRSLGGVTYPVATTNGGKTWDIDGPELHVPAANAPNVVTQVGACGPATYFIFGGLLGGNSVSVTTDAGKQWYRAYLGGAVLAVVATSSEHLYAFVGQPGVYYSDDGGRVWHYSASVPAP
jgi:hypothetical protein